MSEQSTEAQMAATDSPKYDAALSFAGENRRFVEEVKAELEVRGITIFYDEDEQVRADQWGEDFAIELTETYFRRARYAIVFVSEHYAKKHWPRQEWRAA